jgi:hypothetical protein
MPSIKAQKEPTMRHIPYLLTIALTLSACGSLPGSIGIIPPTGPQLTDVPRQTLQPGQQVTVPLNYTVPTGKTVTLSVATPAPELLTAAITGTTLTLTAATTATPQGLIPVTLTATDGTNTTTTRVPVEIGTLIQQEFARFNAVRAQANLNPVSFDENTSMNCWLHGRYTLLNGVLEHTENLSLPFATPEGRDCASKSNLSVSYSPISKPLNLNLTDGLFTAPFHAVGMLDSTQTSVGLGAFVRTNPNYSTFSEIGGGITSILPSNLGTPPAPVMFPGNATTTDLSVGSQGERPNPIASCPTFDPTQRTGLPLIVTTGTYADTTASNATITEDGQPVNVCAYGSTQYVNTSGGTINYTTGPVSEQDVGRSILKGYGAVFIVPQKPLNPGKTYAVSVNVNGQPISWSFKTSSSLKTQSINTQSTPALQ